MHCCFLEALLRTKLIENNDLALTSLHYYFIQFTPANWTSGGWAFY